MTLHETSQFKFVETSMQDELLKFGYIINSIQYIAHIVKENHYDILTTSFCIVDNIKLTVQKYLNASMPVRVAVFPNISE